MRWGFVFVFIGTTCLENLISFFQKKDRDFRPWVLLASTQVVRENDDSKN